MSRRQRSRTLYALAATAFAAGALPVLVAGTASATPDGGCRSATVQYRMVDADGKPVGPDWTSQGGFHQWESTPGTVEVRLAPDQKVGEGCTYPVSLAEYTTEGPDWFSSGKQALVDKSTVYLDAKDVATSGDEGRSWQKLTVKFPDCYGQIDLYGDDVTYDGKTGEGHGPLPDQPTGVMTPYHLIAAWNGGDKACEPGKPGEPNKPESPTPTPSESTPGTPATPGTPEESAPPKESTPPAEASKPPASASTPPTTSDVPPLASKPPASPAPSPSDSATPLAETGANSSTGLIAGGAVVALGLGGGAVYLASRSRARRS
ncbi:LAETG motif-containing sortase-dependent surface protein [Streptomyces griseoviridis]|uniref:LAETG motif-containing sortase-dependent surface protein n=1 Tax=Streptomyces griseoviridis TaxID=45398 RepID=UPI0034148BCB